MEGRDPLLPDEYLLRRITAFKYDANSSFPIPPDHFNPREADHDGISFFQESSTTPQQLADLANKHGWLIARIQVRELHEIGLTAIQELNYANSKSNPNVVDLLKKDLAKLASQRIVHRSAPKFP